MDNNRIPSYFVMFLLMGMSSCITNARYKRFYFLCAVIVLSIVLIELCGVIYSDHVNRFKEHFGVQMFFYFKTEHIFLSLQALFNHKKEESIFRELADIDDLITSKLFQWIDLKKSRREIVVNTLPLLIANAACLVDLMVIIQLSLPGCELASVSILSAGAIYGQYIHFIYVVSLVGQKLKLLSSLTMSNTSRPLKLERLYAMRCVFHKITIVRDKIDDIFGWSLIVMVTGSLLQLATVLSWIVLGLIAGKGELNLLLTAPMILIPEIIALGTTCKVCQDCESTMWVTVLTQVFVILQFFVHPQK